MEHEGINWKPSKVAQKEQGGWLVDWRRGLAKKGTALVYKGKEGRRPRTQSPFLPILSRWPLGGSLWSVRHNRKKKKFVSWKETVTTVDVRVMGQVTAEVGLVSKVSQDTTQACVRDIWWTDRVMARCSQHKILAQKISRYQSSFRWRFKESPCGLTWLQARGGISYQEKQSRS